MGLFADLFSDTVGLMSVFTLVVILAIPLVIAVVIRKGMSGRE